MAKKGRRPALPAGVVPSPRFKQRRKAGKHRKHFPLRDRTRSTLIDTLHDENDRGVAILGANLLENYLALALMSRFRRLTPEEHDQLFDRENAALGGLHAKIQIGHALRLFSKHVAEELHAIKRIRNKFAHRLNIHSFNSPEVAEHFKALESYRYIDTDAFNATPEVLDRTSKRGRYIGGVVELSIRFDLERAYAPSRPRDAVHGQPLPWPHIAVAPRKRRTRKRN
jgi:hypothetical protein